MSTKSLGMNVGTKGVGGWGEQSNREANGPEDATRKDAGMNRRHGRKQDSN